MYKTLNIIIGGEQKHQSIKTDGICTCLCSAMGTGGGYVPMIVEEKEMAELINFCVDKNAPDGSFGKADNARAVDIRTPVARTITCKEPGFSVHHSNLCIVAMRGRENGQRLEPNTTGTTNTLTTVQKDNLVLEKKIKKVGQISNEGSQCGTVVSEDGLAPAISAGCHGYANPHILAKEKVVLIKQATKDGFIPCKVGGCFDSSYPNSKNRRGMVQGDGDIVPTLTAGSSENINYIEPVNGFYEQAIETAERENAQPGDVVDAFNKKVLKDGISPTITTRPEGKKTAILPVTQQYRIRKLTPKECWRLMGYTDEDFEKAAAVNSNTQLYKQAGNAIVKQVLMAIFSQMIPENARHKGL